MKALTVITVQLLLWSLLLFTPLIKAEHIKVVTEHLPPYQYIGKDNQLDGLAFEIVEALFEHTQYQKQYEMLPWARAYEMALTQNNVMIFSITRSKQRQAKFKWVGDFIKQHYYFLRLKSRNDIKINHIQDVKKYLTGVSRDSFEHQLLNKYGFSQGRNLHVNVQQTPLIEMLFDEKIDLIFGSKVSLLGLMEYVNRNPKDIRLSYRINESPGHVAIAFSRQTDDAIVNRFRRAFVHLQATGQLEKIKLKWLNKLNAQEIK